MTEGSVGGGRSRLLILGLGMFGAPLAFACQLALSYAMVPWACARGAGFALHLVSLIAAGIAMVSLLISWSQTREHEESPEPDDVHAERRCFMAWWGVIASSFFLLAIAAVEIPNLVLGTCAI